MVELETVLKQAVARLARQDAEAFKPPKDLTVAAGGTGRGEADGDGSVGPGTCMHGAEEPATITVDEVRLHHDHTSPVPWRW